MPTQKRGAVERRMTEMQALNVEVPVELWRDMKVLAAQQRTSMAEEVRRALAELLQRERSGAQAH
jgi:quinol monooxygenase YgiN